MNNNEKDSKDPKEFYENSNPEEVSLCNHHFERVGTSRVMCSKCGLGFFDSPFDPFPIDEINKQIESEVNSNRYYKNKQKKLVENN